MLIEKLLPIVLLLAATAAMSATLFGMVALWAATAQKSWFWRVTPLAILLAALVPIGAYELIALYGAQAAVVIGLISAQRCIRGWRDRRSGGTSEANRLASLPRSRWQFNLVDGLKGVALAAAVFAIARNAAPSSAATIGAPIEWLAWAAAGASLGTTTWAAYWLVSGRVRLRFRLIAMMLATIATFEILEVCRSSIGAGVAATSTIQMSTGWILFCAGLHEWFVLGGLLLLRCAGWAWWSPDRAALADPEKKPQIPSRIAPVWQQSARVALGGAAIAGGWLMGCLYWQLLPGAPPAEEPLPNPNGYVDLQRAGAAINWNAIPLRDIDEATIPSLQTFVQDNSHPLVLTHEAFLKRSQRPLEFTNVFFSANWGSISTMRDVARVLTAEGRVAAAAGNHGKAVESYLGIVRLANDISRGGLMVDDLVGDAIAGIGSHKLADEMQHLDPTSFDVVRRSLEQLAEQREPFDRFRERENSWDRLAYGWNGRLWFAIEDMAGMHDWDHLPAEAARTRVMAHLHLILAEAAVRRFVLVNGSPPESLAALVPEFLSAVPQDPYGDGPLIYRRTADGYLLYSVGNNGIDDGGQRESIQAATLEGKGDLFFDAPDDYQQNATGTAADATYNGADEDATAPRAAEPQGGDSQ